MSIMLPPGARAKQLMNKVTGAGDRVQIARALVRHHLAQGGYPEALNTLTPAYLPQVPKDPADGQPMRYRRNSSDALLYSIGDNHRDDGGELKSGLDDGVLLANPRK